MVTNGDNGGNETITVRLIDDILTLSINLDEIKRKFEKLKNGNFYGQINESKIVCSWADRLLSPLTWAGFTLRPRAGYINVSPSPDSVVQPIGKYKSIGQYFHSSLGRSIAQQCLRGLFNPLLNSKECVNENAYRAGSFAGRRLRNYVSRGGRDEELCDFSCKFERFMRRRFKSVDPTRRKELLKYFFHGLEHSIVGHPDKS
jgi:hypothetical protein